jgi:hypothetical protein
VAQLFSLGHIRTIDFMGDLLGYLIEFVAQIWGADTEIRDRSILGESEMDRCSRRFVAWLCGSIIFILIVAGFSWWWFTRNR